MNERIKELAEQAEIISVVAVTGSLQYVGKGEVESLEKFAELIVKECEVALNPMLRDMISRGQAYDLIKTHFGVK